MSYNTYDASVWFRLYRDKLKKDLNPSNDLKIEENISHACTAGIIRLNPDYPSNENLDPFDILYIRRAIKNGDPWSGQVAFPGGKHENNETLQETAERETMEEIGLNITESKGDYICIGYCHKMDITRGKHTLRVICFVFLQCAEQTPKLTIHKNEVDSVSWINLSQLTQIPLTIKDKDKYPSKMWKGNISETNDFHGRHSMAWSNMMVDPILNAKIIAINNTIGCQHVDLYLEFKHRIIPRNTFKYPAVILRTGIKENDYWLLWGLTYTMTGYLLTAIKLTHYLRYKYVSKGSYRIGYQILFFVRTFLGLDLKWRSAGIEPYFSNTVRSKL